MFASTETAFSLCMALESEQAELGSLLTLIPSPCNSEVVKSSLSEQQYELFVSVEDDVLNDFEMMWQLRTQFPLHFFVFKQSAFHLEQVFSHSGSLGESERPVTDQYRNGSVTGPSDARCLCSPTRSCYLTTS
jgi:hypothetical protein